MLLTPAFITFEPPMYLHSEFFGKVTQLALSYINAMDDSGKFMFIENHLKKTVRSVFAVHDTSLPSDEELNAFCVGLFMGKETEVRICNECIRGALAQTTNDGTQISFNTEWVARAESVCSMAFRSTLHDSSEYLESRYHLVCGVVKFIHELMHTFTPQILQFENELRKKSEMKSKPMKVTPVKVGTKVDHDGRAVGDMGYLFEEQLFSLEESDGKIRLLLKHVPYIWEALDLHFEVKYERIGTVELNAGSSKRKRSESTVKYEFSIFHFADEGSGYALAVMDSFESFLANPNAETFNALAQAFKINESDLQLVGKGVTKTLTGSALTRKSTPASFYEEDRIKAGNFSLSSDEGAKKEEIETKKHFGFNKE